MKKYWLVGILLALVVGGAVAAPRALSIFINNVPFSGKALWYKDRIYVSVEDLAGSLNATYSYTPASGEVRLTTSQAGNTNPAVVSGYAPNTPTSMGRSPLRPYVQVLWKQQYLYSNNAKVIATFKNAGDAVAHSVEAICIFKDTQFKPINAEVRFLGDMAPGETRTAEFYLYPSGGYAPGGSGYTPWYGGYAGFGIVDDDKISIRGTLSNVRYEFKLNYPDAPDTGGRADH